MEMADVEFSVRAQIRDCLPVQGSGCGRPLDFADVRALLSGWVGA
jgi:hypothetical protein